MKKTRMQMPINHFASKKLHICYTTHYTNNKISELSVSTQVSFESEPVEKSGYVFPSSHERTPKVAGTKSKNYNKLIHKIHTSTKSNIHKKYYEDQAKLFFFFLKGSIMREI